MAFHHAQLPVHCWMLGPVSTNIYHFDQREFVDWSNMPLGQEGISVAIAVFDVIECASPRTM